MIDTPVSRAAPLRRWATTRSCFLFGPPRSPAAQGRPDRDPPLGWLPRRLVGRRLPGL